MSYLFKVIQRFPNKDYKAYWVLVAQTDKDSPRILLSSYPKSSTSNSAQQLLTYPGWEPWVPLVCTPPSERELGGRVKRIALERNRQKNGLPLRPRGSQEEKGKREIKEREQEIGYDGFLRTLQLVYC